jgi:hypothetical protein
MVQNGFAMLFLLALAAGGFSLVRTVRESWRDIHGALVPRPSPSAPVVYRTATCPAAEVPWVAQRLVLRELDEALPEAVLPSAWVARPMTAAALG